MTRTSDLGDAWVSELASYLKSHRDKNLKHYAACKKGGTFGKQVLKIAQAYDRAYLAVINPEFQGEGAAIDTAIAAQAQKKEGV